MEEMKGREKKSYVKERECSFIYQWQLFKHCAEQREQEEGIEKQVSWDARVEECQRSRIVVNIVINLEIGREGMPPKAEGFIWLWCGPH